MKKEAMLWKEEEEEEEEEEKEVGKDGEEEGRKIDEHLQNKSPENWEEKKMEEMRGKYESKYCGSTSDAIASSSLIASLYMLLFDDVLPSKRPYSSFKNNLDRINGSMDG